MSRLLLMTVGLSPLPDQSSVYALIAAGGLEIGMAGATEAFKICRSKAGP